MRKIQYTYTDFGKEEQRVITVSRDYSNWENNSKFYFGYNKNQVMNFNERSVWRDEEWQKVVSSTFDYENDLIATRIDSAFLPSGDINITAHTYSYNDQDLVIEELAERIGEEEKTVTSRLLHSYNEHNLIAEKTWQRYNNGEWVNLRRMVFTYNDGLDHIETLRQNWQENEWQHSIKYLLTVSEEGKRTDALWQRYTENSWQDFRKVTYEY